MPTLETDSCSESIRDPNDLDVFGLHPHDYPRLKRHPTQKHVIVDPVTGIAAMCMACYEIIYQRVRRSKVKHEKYCNRCTFFALTDEEAEAKREAIKEKRAARLAKEKAEEWDDEDEDEMEGEDDDAKSDGTQNSDDKIIGKNGEKTGVPYDFAADLKLPPEAEAAPEPGVYCNDIGFDFDSMGNIVPDALKKVGPTCKDTLSTEHDGMTTFIISTTPFPEPVPVPFSKPVPVPFSKVSPSNNVDIESTIAPTESSTPSPSTESDDEIISSGNEDQSDQTIMDSFREMMVFDYGAVGVYVSMYELIREFVYSFIASLSVNHRPLRMTWYHGIKKSSRVEFALQVLVILILSQSATDEQALAAGLPFVNFEGFCLEWIIETPTSRIAQLISRAGKQYKNAGFIKDCAVKILNDFGGKMPRTVKELMKLPGVGSKTAIIICKTCYSMLYEVSKTLKLYVTSEIL